MFPTKILLATNGTDEAVRAEDAAIELSSSTGSDLHVVHVVNTTFGLPYPHTSMRGRSEALLDQRKLYGLGLLDRRVRRIEELGGSVAASYYREGTPEKEVRLLARELDIGLILTGGCRRPWFERLFGAGFSEQVSRRANCPVLVVGERGAKGSAVPT